MQTFSDRRSIAGAALVLALGLTVAAAAVASVFLLVGEPATGGVAGVRRLRAPIVHLARLATGGVARGPASHPSP